MSLLRATPAMLLAGLTACIALLLACASCAQASAGAGALRQPSGAGPLDAGALRQPPGAASLDAYIAGVARAWEPLTAPDGRVNDPLDAADTGDNYGVILLADVMLQAAHRSGDSALEAAGTRIIAAALTLPVPNDPFNLLAIAAAIHDGQRGYFPARAWTLLAAGLERRAGEIGPPTEATCLIELSCYDNWRLVWSAGAALLSADRLAGVPRSLAGNAASASAQIDADLALAVAHAGPPLRLAVAGGGGARSGARKTRTPSGLLRGSAAGGPARELSDPGAEPPSYELFSTFMLELVGELDPHAITPAVARLRRQADRYALDMMAPDGQLSSAGRSLDQSWVQAAAAALGARRAVLDPSAAKTWRSYAERAVSYLLAAYPLRADGLLPIVPGLSVQWNPSIMDGYAALNQYEGLTLWLLCDALARWPSPGAAHAPLPGDSRELVADDLGSSGLLWGRAGPVWWQLSGRSTSGDPRSAQGLVAVKVMRAGHWRDLLALRPRRHGLSSVWTLTTAAGRTGAPIFTRARGRGRRVILSGAYRQASGHPLARATWTLLTTARGVRLSMTMPVKALLHTTIWLASGHSRLSAPGASLTRARCIVTASGRACPVTIHWRERRNAVLEVGP